MKLSSKLISKYLCSLRCENCPLQNGRGVCIYTARILKRPAQFHKYIHDFFGRNPNFYNYTRKYDIGDPANDIAKIISSVMPTEE